MPASSTGYEDFDAAVHLTSRGVSSAAVAPCRGRARRRQREVPPTRGSRPPRWSAWPISARRLAGGRRGPLDRGDDRRGGAGGLGGGDEREDEVERTRLTMMRRYAEHAGCRRSFLLSYFGQDYPGPCGNCDNDLATKVRGSRRSSPFAVGARVMSERWGQGTVQRYDGDQVTVLFDEHGYRDLLVPLVVERRLLRRVL